MVLLRQGVRVRRRQGTTALQGLQQVARCPRKDGDARRAQRRQGPVCFLAQPVAQSRREEPPRRVHPALPGGDTGRPTATPPLIVHDHCLTATHGHPHPAPARLLIGSIPCPPQAATGPMGPAPPRPFVPLPLHGGDRTRGASPFAGTATALSSAVPRRDDG